MRVKLELLEQIQEARLDRNNNGMYIDFLTGLMKVLSRDIPSEYSPSDFMHELAIEYTKMEEED